MIIRKIPYLSYDKVEWNQASEEERDAFIGRCVKGFFDGPVMVVVFLFSVVALFWMAGAVVWWTESLFGVPEPGLHGLLILVLLAGLAGLLVGLAGRLRSWVKR